MTMTLKATENINRARADIIHTRRARRVKVEIFINISILVLYLDGKCVMLSKNTKHEYAVYYYFDWFYLDCIVIFFIGCKKIIECANEIYLIA